MSDKTCPNPETRKCNESAFLGNSTLSEQLPFDNPFDYYDRSVEPNSDSRLGKRVYDSFHPDSVDYRSLNQISRFEVFHLSAPE